MLTDQQLFDRKVKRQRIFLRWLIVLAQIFIASMMVGICLFIAHWLNEFILAIMATK